MSIRSRTRKGEMGGRESKGTGFCTALAGQLDLLSISRIKRLGAERLVSCERTEDFKMPHDTQGE